MKKETTQTKQKAKEGAKESASPVENYRKVLFIDNSNNSEFIIASTVATEEKGKAADGKEYPIYRVEISSASHPFYTGTEKSLDTAGRVEKFKSRVAKAKAGKSAK